MKLKRSASGFTADGLFASPATLHGQSMEVLLGSTWKLKKASEKVLRVLSRRLQEGFLEHVLQWFPEGRKEPRRVLRRCSKKKELRRQGKNTPFFREYDRLREHPMLELDMSLSFIWST